MTVVKFMGIIIDEKLNWKTQIQSVKSKLASVLSVMQKACVKINIDGMYTLYCSLFHPYLSYCLEIWGNTYASNIKCLFTMQKKQSGYYVVLIDLRIQIHCLRRCRF